MNAPPPLPLHGVRVLDLTRLLPGGLCTMLLADLGADVVKVEDTGVGDYARWVGESVEGVEASAASAQFAALNRNKRSARIDLKAGAGRDALLALARGADVLVESFRPGVLDRLGVGYDVLAAENPRIVHCAITGYGQDGPLRSRAGHDVNYLALAGLLSMGGGPAERSPELSAAQIADVGGGALPAAFAILAALRQRDLTGRGQSVDVSMAHGALQWLSLPAADLLAGGATPKRSGGLVTGKVVCYGVYPCADGHVSLGALEPQFWAAFCRGVGREDLLEHRFDPPGSPTEDAVREICAARTREEWAAFAAEHDCCLEPVLDLEEALASPLVTERGMVVESERPGASAPVRQVGGAVRYGDVPDDPVRTPPPGLGEHTAEVLAEAGLAREDVERLLADGAVAGLPEPGMRVPGILS